MKTNLLITSLSLIATSAYAQPSVPSVGLPPPTVRAEMPGQGVPSMPQPQMNQPTIPNHGGRPAAPLPPFVTEFSSSVGAVPVNPQEQENIARMIALPPLQPVGATGGSGGSGGNGGLLVGNGGAGGSGATPMPLLPANDVKGPTSVGASQSEAQAKVRLEEAHENSSAIFANANFQSPIMQTVESAALASTVNPGDKAKAKAQRREMDAKLYTQKAKAKAQRLENAAEGPTSVGATGVSTLAPSMPANDVNGPTSVGGHHQNHGPGHDVDYNDLVMRLVPEM